MKQIITGRALGLLLCLECHATVREGRTPYPRCPRCHARLHVRKPHSLAITTLLVISAAVLYVPANLLPVMNTQTFFDDEKDTIMSGVLTLMESGSWPIGLLVFIASIVVPWRCYSIRRGDGRPNDACSAVNYFGSSNT